MKFVESTNEHMTVGFWVPGLDGSDDAREDRSRTVNTLGEPWWSSSISSNAMHDTKIKQKCFHRNERENRSHVYCAHDRDTTALKFANNSVDHTTRITGILPCFRPPLLYCSFARGLVLHTFPER